VLGLCTQAPPNRISHEPLVHRMQKCFERMPVGQMAKPSTSRIAHPSGRGGLAIVRPISQQQVNSTLIVARRMLLVRHEERAHSTSNGMVWIHDCDPKAFEWSMAAVSAAD